MSDNQEYTGHVYCPRCKKTHWVNHDCGVTLSDEEKNNQEHKALTNLMAEVKLPNDDNMNYDYIADTWVILKIISEDYPDGVYKLLCTFRGGYINGDEWRISSGITNVQTESDYHIITNESGSIYKCYKGAECMSSLTSSIYEKFKKELKDDLEIVNIDEYLKSKNENK